MLNVIFTKKKKKCDILFDFLAYQYDHYAKLKCYSTQIESKMVRIHIADALDSTKNLDVITVFDVGQNIWEDALWKQ